jgi:hypothetical protein
VPSSEKYVAMSLTSETRDRLTRAAARATGLAERKISMSALVLAALDVADAHPDELLARLTRTTDDAAGAAT